MYQGDCLEVMKTMKDNSIDFIITDPPYGLHFMGKTWDHFKRSNFDETGKYKYLENSSFDNHSRYVRKIETGNSKAGTYDERRNDQFQEFIFEVGKEMLRILKPGAHIAMWGAPRRFHRQTCGLEDAGFEIRDCIMWLFGSGFPKSHNNFGLKGFGTALKPAYEPIILAMKPLEGTYSQNVEKWGLGGINIDACRILSDEVISNHSRSPESAKSKGIYGDSSSQKTHQTDGQKLGRWPANLILDEEAGQMLDELSGISRSSNATRINKPSENKCMSGANTGHVSFGHNDSGGASRFFYCAKASKAERNRGLEKPSSHPTVKPLALMRYIIKLLAPPGDPLLLDPFAGSGSTLIAAKELGIRFIGIEKEAEYCEIAEKRLASFKIHEQFEFNF